MVTGPFPGSRSLRPSGNRIRDRSSIQEVDLLIVEEDDFPGWLSGQRDQGTWIPRTISTYTLGLCQRSLGAPLSASEGRFTGHTTQSPLELQKRLWCPRFRFTQ